MKYTIKSLATTMIAALLLAILVLPLAGSGTPVASGASIAASKSAPFAAYTRRRRVKRVIKRRRVRHHHHRVVRRRKVARRPVATAPVAPLAIVAAPVAPTAPVVDEAALAQTILDGLKAQYPRYLSNATVSMGDAMGYQAISYYTSGRIVVSPTHTATLSRIMNHEIWHIIDWQDDGALDWGEAIPPTNMSTYAN
ncbi:MAG: hypothetical protein Q7W16_07660 [Coriobacteriia bacterium]|nr:hypothetical protein [Coriobacteriia bacterium]